MSMRLATAVACGLAVAAAFAPPRGPLRASPARGASAAGATTSAGDDVCAMLSLNARGVNGATVRAAREALGEAHVFATASLDEAEVAARVIVDRATASFWRAAATARQRRPSRSCARPPGTWRPCRPSRRCRWARATPWRATSAAAATRGAGPGVRRCVDALRESAARRTLDVPILETGGGDLCFIAGMGYDAFILDDYERLVRSVRAPPRGRSAASSATSWPRRSARCRATSAAGAPCACA
ncbi:hypothetical protein JL722_3733 [Aureococcus anophagefferens]|nr:hypothetical protein JL722_3733 [Aureococcus anophagefferens]